MAIVATETWTGSNGAGWSAQWNEVYADIGTAATIQGNTGQQAVGAGLINVQLLDIAALGDQELLISWAVTAAVQQFPNLYFRTSDDGQNGYSLELFPYAAENKINLTRWDAGVATVLDTEPAVGIDDTTRHWLRIRSESGRIRVRWWDDGSGEPGTWTFDVDDDTHAAGKPLLVEVGGAGAGTIQWASFTVDDLVAIPDPPGAVANRRENIWLSEGSAAKQIGQSGRLAADDGPFDDWLDEPTLEAPVAPTLIPGVGELEVDLPSLPGADQVDVRWRMTRSLPTRQERSGVDWPLQIIDDRDDADFGHYYDGTGVMVYLIDSGVNGDHAEFGGRVWAGASGSAQNGEPTWTRPDPWDDTVPHGTACATAAIGALHGVASGAELYIVKAGGLWVSGGGGFGEADYNIPPGPGTGHEGSEGLTIDAYEWAYEHIAAHFQTLPAGTRAVISDSTTARSYTGTGALPLEAARLEAAVQACLDLGIFVVNWAGNFDKATNHVPALMDGVIAAGGVNEGLERFVNVPNAYGSAFGPAVDIYAPCRVTNAARADNDTLYETNGDGTSSATPYTAGAVAGILQANPHISITRGTEVLTSQAWADVIDLQGATNTANRLLNSLANTSDWSVTSDIADGFVLDGLEPGEEYEIQIRQWIDGEASDWSTAASETTEEPTTDVTSTPMMSATSSSTAVVQGYAAITPTPAVSATSSSTASITAQADIAGTAASSATSSPPAAVAAQTDVTGTAAVSATTSSTANVTGQADITGAAASSATTSAIADVGGAVNVDGVPATSSTSSTTANVTGQTDVAGIPAASATSSPAAAITATAEISGAPAASATTSPPGVVTAQTDVAGQPASSSTTSPVANVGSSSGVEGTPAVSITSTGVAQIDAQADIAGIAATSVTVAGVAQISTSTVVDGAPATITATMPTAAIVATATITAVAGISPTSSSVAQVTGHALVLGTPMAVATSSSIANVAEVLVVPPVILSVGPAELSWTITTASPVFEATDARLAWTVTEAGAIP